MIVFRNYLNYVRSPSVLKEIVLEASMVALRESINQNNEESEISLQQAGYDRPKVSLELKHFKCLRL
jgi:hypothetical protein